MQVDSSFYYKRNAAGELVGVAVMYVDDVLAAGESDAVNILYAELASKVVLKAQDPLEAGKCE